MTTLIITEEGFYSDGRACAGLEIIDDSFPKVFSYKGSAIGTTGSADDMVALAKALVDDEDLEEFSDKDGLVFIRVDGVTRCYEFRDRRLVVLRRTGTECFGSGASFARAALDFGKTEEEAIAYAATRDAGTGGKIHKVLFEDL